MTTRSDYVTVMALFVTMLEDCSKPPGERESTLENLTWQIILLRSAQQLS